MTLSFVDHTRRSLAECQRCSYFLEMGMRMMIYTVQKDKSTVVQNVVMNRPKCTLKNSFLLIMLALISVKYIAVGQKIRKKLLGQFLLVAKWQSHTVCYGQIINS